MTLGLKHAHPKIEEAVDELAAAGFRRIVGLVLAPHYSSFSVGQYQDRLRTALEPSGCDVRAIDSWASNAAYVGFLGTEVKRSLAALPEDQAHLLRLSFFEDTPMATFPPGSACRSAP